ncbi:MAG TPA: flagellar hook-length control protein FliK [Solirubrobacteraceae bacterium]|nr:flagellar hook-length control protein FliK [Solirubrobacteraceae bacterium]
MGAPTTNATAATPAAPTAQAAPTVQTATGGDTPSGGGTGSQSGAGSESGTGSHADAPRTPGAPATQAPGGSPAVSTDVTPAAPALALAATPSTPANQPAPVTAHAVPVPVSLADAADAVEATITMAARGAGITQARIELSPESLGDIQIHLQHTADGLVARVITAHPEAAQTLQASSDELRRSLEQSGAALLSLDISTSGRGDGEPAADRNGSSSAGAAGVTEGDEPSTSPSPERVADLSGSALVNVLA